MNEEDVVFMFKTVQITPFRTLMSALKDILLETNIIFQAEDGIRDSPQSRGLGDVYKRQIIYGDLIPKEINDTNKQYYVMQSLSLLMKLRR